MSTGSQPAKIACPHCQALIKSPALATGSLVNCPKCGQAFRLGEAKGPGDAEQATGGAVPRPTANVQRPDNKREVQTSKVKVQSQPKLGPAPPPPPPDVRQLALPPPPPGTAGQASSATRSGLPAQSPPAVPRAALRAPRSPDTVDPNLLPPPPPVAKPKPTQVAIVCYLCGTRTYAPLEKIGQTIKCPDCHTLNEVPPLKGEPPAKTAAPTLEGTEEYGMSEVVDRPKYRPLQAARGEYEVLSALDPASIEHRLTAPGQPVGRGRKPGPAATVAAEPAADEEVSLEAPAERVTVEHIPVNYVEIDPEDAMYDGRYDDTAIGDFVDPRTPDAWKRAPFLYGILGILWQPATIMRLIGFGIWLGIVAVLARLGLAYAREDGQVQIIALFIMWGGIPTGVTWLVACAAAIQAVIESTANGETEVSNWPDWNVYEWFALSRFILIATFVAGLPGAVLAGATLAASVDDPAMAAFGIAAPPVLSWMVLFPFVLYSMMVEDTVFAVMSNETFRSLKVAADGWVFFYMYSIVLVLLATGAAAMMLVDQFLVVALGSCAMVAVLIVYARLLGRLMWYTGQREAAGQQGTGNRGQGAAVRSS